MKKYNTMRTAAILISSMGLLSTVAQSDELEGLSESHRFSAHANLIGNYNDSSVTWLNGGLGRFDQGSNGDNSRSLLGEAQIGYKYSVSDNFSVQTHVQFQDTSYSSSARAIGLVELKMRYVLAPSEDQRITLTAGQFFLPISMENIDQFWESPYTIGFSALNSWIGEEFRPIGFDVNYAVNLNSGNRWSIAATAFGGNDSMGAILAWRGWSHGRHRSVYGDSLSLPNLSSLATGGDFQDQRDDGSKPFGPDLDGRAGYALRTSWTDNSSYKVNLTWVDNLGDKGLHHGEYAWRTRFAIAGLSWFITDDLIIVSEATNGNAAMGPGPSVDIDFYAVYLMSSLQVNDFRYSARIEKFETKDQDELDEENNDEGHSYTLAVMWSPSDTGFSGGVEAFYINNKRERTLVGGAFEDENNTSISLLLKYTF